MTIAYGWSSGTVASIPANTRSTLIDVYPPAMEGYTPILGLPSCWNGGILTAIYSWFNGGNTPIRFVLQNEYDYAQTDVSWGVRWLYVKD